MATAFHKDYNAEYVIGDDVVNSEEVKNTQPTVLSKIIDGKPADVNTETKDMLTEETVWFRNDRIRQTLQDQYTEVSRQTFEIDQFETTDLPGNP